MSCLILQFLSSLIPSIEARKMDFLFIICKSDIISEIAFTLKNSTNAQFNNLIDIAGLDFIENTCRTAVSYNFLSTRFNQRLRVLTFLGELNFVNSLSNIFKSSSWLEREAWDLYGIFFRLNTDLRRILTDYGFEGHPLRKDFPLQGFFDTSYSSSKEGISQEMFFEPYKQI
jgi:NADH dehydrogenase (ubiquinone) Fe-S protein 3